MGTKEFLSCLSRQALERFCKDTSVLPRARVKDTRAALVEHFREARFVHPTALFAPTAPRLAAADLTLCNLECPLSTRGLRAAKPFIVKA